MNITFLIGNGFDLNLGLKTKYSDFLKVYQRPQKDDNEMIRMFREDIESHLDLWSYAEKAFGKYTATFSAKELSGEDFCECHEHFCESLADYLEKEEAKVVLDKVPNISHDFFKSIYYTNIIAGFREQEKEELNIASSYAEGVDTYQFVVFNYTRLIDKIIKRGVKQNIKPQSRKYSSGRVFESILGHLYHVHGYVDSDMVLGVNDESQIADTTLFDGYGEEYKNQIIKQKTNLMNGQNIDKKVKELISTSDLIVVYGMSIGETDALWWKRIIDLMQQKTKLHIIIYKRDMPNAKLVQRKRITYTKQQVEDFLKYSKLDENMKKTLAQRIHITDYNFFEALKDIATNTDNEDNEEKQLVSV